MLARETADAANSASLLEEKLGRKPRICILSLSYIPDDPRVRRQGDAFYEAGWEVTAIGLPGWRSPLPAWPILTWDDLPPAGKKQDEPSSVEMQIEEKTPGDEKIEDGGPGMQPASSQSSQTCEAAGEVAKHEEVAVEQEKNGAQILQNGADEFLTDSPVAELPSLPPVEQRLSIQTPMVMDTSFESMPPYKLRFIIIRKLILTIPALRLGRHIALTYLKGQKQGLNQHILIQAARHLAHPTARLWREPLSFDTAYLLSRKRFKIILRTSVIEPMAASLKTISGHIDARLKKERQHMEEAALRLKLNLEKKQQRARELVLPLKHKGKFFLAFLVSLVFKASQILERAANAIIAVPSHILSSFFRFLQLVERRISRVIDNAQLQLQEFKYERERFFQRLQSLVSRASIMVYKNKGPEFYLQVPEIERFYRLGTKVDADIYLANDWHMLPVAMKLAKENGAEFCYDTHEYALEEYRYRYKWHGISWQLKRLLIRSIESQGLENALVRSAVSQGIAQDMARQHKSKKPILEIRNVPDRLATQPKPLNEYIDVLYHGLIVEDRGLEESIRSVAHWRPEFRFTLRGPGPSEYRAHLERIVHELDIADRVLFAPSVAMTELIEAAAAADIGLSTPPRTSKHNIYALPNKFFEYIQAGLALCVADLPDMTKIVHQYSLGILIDQVQPEHIARAINRFDRMSLHRYKANSLMAATQLNWQCEKTKLVDTYSDELLKLLSKKPLAARDNVHYRTESSTSVSRREHECI